MHLDEYARLGTSIVHLAQLRERREDLIAVFATALSRFAGNCRSWTTPQGVTDGGWRALMECPWRGNVRTLLRVVESSSIAFAIDPGHANVIEEQHVRDALALWEPPDGNFVPLDVNN